MDGSQILISLLSLVVSFTLQLLGCQQPGATKNAGAGVGATNATAPASTLERSSAPVSGDTAEANASSTTTKPSRHWQGILEQENFALSSVTAGYRAFEWRYGRMPANLQELQSGPYILFAVSTATGGSSTYIELPDHRADAPANTTGVCIDGKYASVEIGPGILGREVSRGVSTVQSPAERRGISASWSADIYRMQEFRSMLIGMLSKYVELEGKQPDSWADVEAVLGLTFVEHQPANPESTMGFILEQDAEQGSYRLRLSGLSAIEEEHYILLNADSLDGQGHPQLVWGKDMTQPFNSKPFASFTIPLVSG